MFGRYLKLFAADREDPAKAITTLIIDLLWTVRIVQRLIKRASFVTPNMARINK